MYNKIRNHLKDYTDIFYMFYFLPLAGCVAMGINSDQLFYKVCFAVALIFFMLKFLVTDYTKIELIVMSLVMFVLAYVFFRTGEKALIITALSVFGCKGVCVRSVLKYTLFVYIIGMMLTISLSMSGKIQGEIHILIKSGIQYKINDFGFSHPNSAYSHLMMIALMIVAVWQERVRWYHYGFLTIVMFVAYKVFLCRTGFYIYMLLCMLIGLFHIMRNNKVKKVFFFLFNFIPMGIFILSYGLMINYHRDISIINKLDNFVTGRIILSSKAYECAGISWFGATDRSWMNWIFIDNAYISVLISCGVLVCILCLIAYSLTCIYYWKAEDYYVVIILGVIAVYAFMEYIVVNVTWSPLLLFMSGALFWNGKNEKKYNENYPS